LPDRSFCAQFSCKTIEVVIGSLFLMASRSEEVCSKLHTFGNTDSSAARLPLHRAVEPVA
jgi:3-oxoacyl-[acyl-carrier-protein] synthase III